MISYSTCVTCRHLLLNNITVLVLLQLEEVAHLAIVRYSTRRSVSHANGRAGQIIAEHEANDLGIRREHRSPELFSPRPRSLAKLKWREPWVDARNRSAGSASGLMGGVPSLGKYPIGCRWLGDDVGKPLFRRNVPAGKSHCSRKLPIILRGQRKRRCRWVRSNNPATVPATILLGRFRR